MPRGRLGHTMSLYKWYVVVFGGLYEITRELNDMYVFDLRTS